MSKSRREYPASDRRAVWLVNFGALIILAIISRIALFIELSPVSPSPEKPVHVVIEKGDRPREIAELLVKKGLARSEFAVYAAIYLSKDSEHLLSGTYALSADMPLPKIIGIIASGKTDSQTVVIPEGFTVVQIAERLSERKLAGGSAFVAAASTEGETFTFPDGFAPPRNLEGYLFPLTYTIVNGSSPRSILKQMLVQFDRRVVSSHPEVHDWRNTIIIASMIEREAKVDSDRPLIASVYYNRLNADMPMQCDATVQYALPKHKARLMYSDLKVESAYNTYLHRGLPPGPICNPGIASIEAAIHPAKTDNLFYVAGPDGRHVFSRTLAEQNREIALLKHSLNDSAPLL